jgi:ABC-type Fe3+/spermidine/putrescine transport system ATPase subunit
VRPEHVKRASAREADFTAEAVITEMFGRGSTIQFRARTAVGQDITIESPGSATPPFRVGETVLLGWRTEDVFVLPSEHEV